MFIFLKKLSFGKNALISSFEKFLPSKRKYFNFVKPLIEDFL